MDTFDYYKYLNKKENERQQEREFMNTFKNFMNNYKMSDSPERKHIGYMSIMDNKNNNDSRAREIVNEMYHYEGDKKHQGEHFSMQKSIEVYNRFKTMLGEIPPEYVYIALNAQYHDYIGLFKSWFGNNIDSKIIESAIVFWFADDDYREDCKIEKYFDF